MAKQHSHLLLKVKGKRDADNNFEILIPAYKGLPDAENGDYRAHSPKHAISKIWLRHKIAVILIFVVFVSYSIYDYSRST